MTSMLSKFVTIGDKIELQAVGRAGEKQMLRDGKKRIFYSSLHDFISEDTMEITMPMEQTKLILLPVDSEFDLVFYSAGGLFQCFARVIDRYKSNNIYLLVMEMTSNLRKYQRREYYRFSCALDMGARNLEEEEIQAMEENKSYSLTPGLPLKQSVIVDISGGGLRFISSQAYEPDSLLYISYHLVKGNEKKKYEVVGKVLSVKKLENRSEDTWEHRVQYYDMDQKTREEIIKYIFEEERKSRRKERDI